MKRPRPADLTEMVGEENGIGGGGGRNDNDDDDSNSNKPETSTDLVSIDLSSNGSMSSTSIHDVSSRPLIGDDNPLISMSRQVKPQRSRDHYCRRRHHSERSSNSGAYCYSSAANGRLRWWSCLLVSCWVTMMLLFDGGNNNNKSNNGGQRSWVQAMEGKKISSGLRGVVDHYSRIGNHNNVDVRPKRSLVDIFDVDGIVDGNGNDVAEPGPPIELDVQTPPMRQSGNPLIQQTLPVAFGITLSVLPTTSRDLLLEQLEPAFEEYLRVRYQNLIELQAAVFGSASAASIELQKVDLRLSILGEVPGKRRTMYWSGRSRYRSRALQQTSDLISVQGVGEINYSLQVDGSNPTPGEVQGTWIAVFEEELMTQARVEEVVEDAGIDGVVRVDRVNVLDPSEVDENPSGSSGTVDSTNGSSNSSNNEDDGLTRPSTLSIVFGFLLVGIATLGLVAYAYIFYRKRQKRLRKKRMMQDSISYPSASAAARAASAAASASASSASNATRNANNISGVNSSMTSNNSGLPPAAILPGNPMIISRDEEEFSEETSYKGLESSLGSEDPSDSFAKELQLAASLDQQAWDDFQRKKEALDRNRKLQAVPGEKGAGTDEREGSDRDQEQVKASTYPARPSNANTSTSLLGGPDAAEGDVDEQGDSIEADLAGNTGYASSFPYGDETPNEERESEVSRAAPWEPYNSGLPPSHSVSVMSEEKKEDVSPTSFFAQQLQNIENDLARFSLTQDRRNQMDALRSTTSSSDDMAASDVVLEVDELSKFVRRYERRKDRRLQRENMLHQRLNAASAGSLSIGMDGQVYVPDKTDQNIGIAPSYSSSLSPPSPRDKDDPLLAPSDTSSKKQSSRRSQDDNLAFISDDEGSQGDIIEDDPGSERSQRLGISPFKASGPDQIYMSTSPIQENSIHSSSIRTDPSRSLSSHKSRLADLRNTDAIIDESQSDVNPAYDRDQMMAAMKAVPQMRPASISMTGQVSRINVGSSRTPSPRVKPTTNKHFNKLRGLFEQKTNAQPDPIYPPTEHWQYGVHKNEAR
jgi:hypothetical protein